MKPSRGTGFGAAESAGTMESSSGSASEALIPRRNVRRCKAFLVTNVIAFLSFCTLIRCLRLAHLKRHTPRHTQDQGGKTIMIAGAISDNRADHRFLVVLHVTARAVHQKLTGHRGDKL